MVALSHPRPGRHGVAVLALAALVLLVDGPAGVHGKLHFSDGLEARELQG
jgi:hypothetical protein